MTEPTVRTRRGAHRARRSLLASLGQVALAVAAVLAVALAVTWGGPQDDGASPVASSPSTVGTAAPTGTPTTAAPPAGEPGSPTPSPSTSPSTTTSPSPSPDDEGEETADEVDRSAPVVVLNQTGIDGLATAVAEDLQADGWTVTGTGGFFGSVPSTTVYYPDGWEADAAALAADLPGEDRFRPTFGNLRRDRLTVVVTEDIR